MNKLFMRYNYLLHYETILSTLTSNSRSMDDVVAKRASATAKASTAVEICKLVTFILLM